MIVSEFGSMTSKKSTNLIFRVDAGEMTEKVERKNESKHIKNGYLPRALAGIKLQEGSLDGHICVRGILDTDWVSGCPSHKQ